MEAKTRIIYPYLGDDGGNPCSLLSAVGGREVRHLPVT